MKICPNWQMDSATVLAVKNWYVQKNLKYLVTGSRYLGGSVPRRRNALRISVALGVHFLVSGLMFWRIWGSHNLLKTSIRSFSEASENRILMLRVCAARSMASIFGVLNVLARTRGGGGTGAEASPPGAPAAVGLGDSCQRGADNPHDFIFWRIRKAA